MIVVGSTTRAAGRRSLLLVAAAVLWVILGLLGMHPLSGAHADAAPHAGAAAMPAQHATTALHADHGTAGQAGPVASSTDGAPPSGHGALIMCALALWAVAVALVAPRSRARLSAPAFRAPPAALRLAILPPLRPPDLHVLSVSRT